MFDKKLIIETIDHVYVEDEQGNVELAINQVGKTVRNAKFRVFDDMRNAWDYINDVVPHCKFNVFDYYVTGKKVHSLEESVEMSELLNVLVYAPWNNNTEFKELIWDEVDQGEPMNRGFGMRGSILMGADFIQKELRQYIWSLLESKDVLVRRKGLVRSALLLPDRDWIAGTMFDINLERERGKSTPLETLKAALKSNGEYPEDDENILRIGNLTFNSNKVLDD